MKSVHGLWRINEVDRFLVIWTAAGLAIFILLVAICRDQVPERHTLSIGWIDEGEPSTCRAVFVFDCNERTAGGGYVCKTADAAEKFIRQMRPYSVINFRSECSIHGQMFTEAEWAEVKAACAEERVNLIIRPCG